MGATPDQIRTEIEHTRADLTQDVNRLADRTSPKRIAHRQTDKARRGVGRLRDRVMGTLDDAKSGMSDTGETIKEHAHQAGDALREAPQAVRSQTQGSPLAAGLVAFGAGLLTAGLLPTTEVERRAGGKLRDSDQLDTLKQEATEAAKGIGEDLGQTAKQAAQHVQETATDSAHQVADAAKDEGARTAERAKGEV
ncbi:DUF3618 domain-containing protein [Actinokineospora soli]|uniref:DUF3618 domain-containing protein n=1 Tax=Actinokineospora soli TaxID=1048753 RepID=A0ABW2TJ88_9PSEU